MIRKGILIGFIVGFFLVAFTLTWVSLSQASLSPDKSELLSCELIHGNDPSKPGMVFFTSKSRANTYLNYLLSVEPFKELQDNFNVYVIEGYEPPCRLYNGIALYCYSKDIIEKAASCPNVKYVVAAEDRPASIRSSAYMQVISINTASPRSVLAHELGHAIAFLAEEYDAGASPPFNSKNCQSTCNQFTGDVEGCFEECSDGSHVRSIENGFMRSLSADTYGALNQRLISEKLQIVNPGSTTGRAITEEDCSSQEYWLFETQLEEGTFHIINQEKKAGCAPLSSSGEYAYRFSNGAGVLSQSEFNPTILFTDGSESLKEGQEPLEGETYVLDSATTYIAVQTDSPATQIDIVDAQQTNRGHALIAAEERAACKLYA